jgi:maleylpyruvate isomerase
MTESTAIEHDLCLVEEGTDLFLAQVTRLDGSKVHEASALPGWTRGHIITHVARNADGMARLATWARTGVEEPMYGDRHPRATDIEAGAPRGLDEQEADVRESAGRLAAAFGGLSGDAWSAPVRTASREVPASYLPWMRAREVWLHALDLDAGATYQDLAPGFAVRLLDDLVGDLSDRPGMPALVMETGERSLEVPGTGVPIRVTGTSAAVACWLSGRPGPVTRPDGGALPPLPAWL